jgi:hypothetical protein
VATICAAGALDADGFMTAIVARRRFPKGARLRVDE